MPNLGTQMLRSALLNESENMWFNNTSDTDLNDYANYSKGKLALRKKSFYVCSIIYWNFLHCIIDKAVPHVRRL